jgi:hypothetical protein
MGRGSTWAGEAHGQEKYMGRGRWEDGKRRRGVGSYALVVVHKVVMNIRKKPYNVTQMTEKSRRDCVPQETEVSDSLGKVSHSHVSDALDKTC